jgi:hypothetical protein
MSMAPNFRKASWGENKHQIKVKEDARLLEESPNQLLYQTQLVGSPATVFYDFQDGGLVSAAYLIDNPNDAVDVGDYFKLVELLTNKYGEPDSKDVNWRDPYRAPNINTYAEAGKAVATGELKLRTVWFTPDSRILLLCTEDSSTYNAMVWVFYHDLSCIEEAGALQDERDLDLL